MSISRVLFLLKKYYLFLAFVILPCFVQAQEVEAEVSIDRSQLSSTSLNYLNDLPNKIEVYINEYNWIDAEFREHERIKMNIQITLLSVDSDFNFEAQIVVQSRRPIYNTTQETVLFIFNDSNWGFTYTPNSTFIHDELQFNRLTGLIDFYIYTVLGYDFDSFEPMSGTPYFNRAQNIISLAQSTSASGWARSSNNRRNRVQLINNLLSANYEGFRTAVYQYHRKGLDTFVNNPPKARQYVLDSLEKIRQAQRKTSSNLVFDTFFNAKYREIVAIFEDADPQVRLEAYNLLSDIDQGHLSEYQKLQ
ncbi:DUF4835 family protein [Fodinibius halophilus]|uniref:DUF4835 family protein n=1 Tax=Fodinibius halophilus TaxID=1736908 RepID=A0A6M1TA22_9BACT|nr:DUF4835 family protein [Fodinibius halophilus]NGP87804.1 DUF4835 family protein [Fodinibius halophilus]